MHHRVQLPPRPAQESTDVSQQLTVADWAGGIVVGVQLQCRDAVGDEVLSNGDEQHT